MTSWVFWIFKRCRHGLFWISMKLSHGYFEYSWSHGHFECSKADVKCKYSWNDLRGILNILKLTSWTFWIFMRWHYWYFEYEVTLWNYSEADAMGILNIHSDIVIFNIHSKLRRFLNIHSNDVTSRIFKIPMSLWIFKIPMTPAFNIPMTALCEYSKYPWC